VNLFIGFLALFDDGKVVLCFRHLDFLERLNAAGF